MTYKKIADIAHVSVSTVSKALSGSAEVSKEVAEEICRIAFEVGYFEEKKKRSKTYRKNTALNIAVIVPEIISVTYSTSASLFKEEIEKRGGFVSVYVFDFDVAKLDAIFEMIMVKGVADGIITFHSPTTLTKPSVPVLCLGETANKYYSTITSDLKKSTEDVIDYLISMGHSKIGYAGEAKTKAKLNAYKNAINNYGLEEYIYVSMERFGDAGKDTARMYMEAEDRPTALICAYDEIAIAFMDELFINGVSIPDDVSVIGMNNVPACEYCTPRLSTVSTDKNNIYEKSINMFMDKIMSGTSEIFHTKVIYEIIKRDSVRNIK